jgi:hypothetical protein
MTMFFGTAAYNETHSFFLTDNWNTNWRKIDNLLGEE